MNLEMKSESGPFDKAQSGQALLVVILTMIVALTVGLSVASRSITNVRISTSEEESQKAFSAAEAGIEELLKSGASTASDTLPNQAIYNARTISAISPNDFVVSGTASKDDAVQIWLSNYPDYANPYGGDITIGWGDSSDSCGPPINAPGLEIIIFYGNVNSPSISRFAVDACSGRGNNFSVANPGPTISGKTFNYGYTMTNFSASFPSVKFMRIIPLYKSTALGVRGSVAIPSQGKVVESTGEVSSGQQKIVRKIKVFQAYPSLPSFFDHAVFSGTSL